MGPQANLQHFFKVKYSKSFRGNVLGGPISDDERGSNASRTDIDGSFAFTNLGPVVHTLRVNAPGFSMAVIKIDVGLDPDNIIVELKEES